MADIPTEPTARAHGGAGRRAAVPRWLPGALAALLFLAVLTRDALLGPAASLVQAALAAGLLMSALAQPVARRGVARLAAWPGLAYSIALLAVLALGVALRLWGLRFGLPYRDHPDEWAVADRALEMLRTGDYNPGSFIYPSLYTYLQMAVAGLHFLWGASAGLYRTLDDIDLARYYVWGRVLTALLGSGALLLTAAIGRLLYGRAVGLLAAALLAVYPAAVGDAHYITTDTPSMCFTLLAFLAIAWLALRPPTQRRDLLALAVLAGLAVGLAVATKYNVAALVLPLALAVVLASQARPAPWGWLGLLGWAGLGTALGFTLGTPFWPRELPRMLNDIASVVVHYKWTGHPGAESSRPALFYWGAFLGEGLLLALAALAGMVLAFVRRNRADLLLLAFAAPYFLQMCGVKVVFFRNAMPLLPFLCLLAAVALVAASGWLSAYRASWRPRPARAGTTVPGRWSISGHHLLLGVLVLLVGAQPLVRATSDDWLRAQPTTRVLATEWVLQQAQAGARIWLEDQTLILPDSLRVQGGRPITSNPPTWYVEQGFRFLVVNSDTPRDDAAQLGQFGEPAARFAPQGRHGPTLAIYDTGLGDPAREERTPSGAELGGGELTLDGYRHPAQAHPGETLPLALYWRANRTPSRDYTVFVHLLDHNDAKRTQRDLPPLEGSRPTSTWRPGELLRDDQDLTLPADLPPGTYRLVVGMYDSATFAPLSEPIPIGTVSLAAGG